MDDELKWYFYIIAAICTGACIGGVTSQYCNHLETLKAMENGYIQQIDPNTSKVIWIKENSDE